MKSYKAITESGSVSGDSLQSSASPLINKCDRENRVRYRTLLLGCNFVWVCYYTYGKTKNLKTKKMQGNLLDIWSKSANTINKVNKSATISYVRNFSYGFPHWHTLSINVDHISSYYTVFINCDFMRYALCKYFR